MSAFKAFNFTAGNTQRLLATALAAVAVATATATATATANSSGNWNFNPSPSPKGSHASKALLGFAASKSVDADALKNTLEAKQSAKSQEYYQSIYNAIAQKIQDEDDHDDGSFGPILVRLAWHNSGSYNQHDFSATRGGSYAGTMRFEREQKDPANAGLTLAAQFLEPIRQKFDISHGDLYTLAGVVGIQEMSGPKIKWRPGRVDLPEESTPPYERLPDASQETGDYIRSVFADRLGFTDKEMVVLIGVGHGIGRCHTSNSGFDGPWTYSPTMVTNEFFKLLLSEEWKIRNWSGPRQYAGGSGLMMLPADMALKKDGKFKQYVEEYAKDEEKCMNDFSVAFAKLLERGVSFGDIKPMTFKTLDEQEE